MSFVFPSAQISARGGGNLQANSGTISARNLVVDNVRTHDITIGGVVRTPSGGILSSDSLTLAFQATGDVADPAVDTGLIYVRDDDKPIYRNSAGVERTLLGAIDLIEEATPVPNGPFTTLKFQGATITAADAGSGVASITVAPGVIVQEQGGSLNSGVPFSTLNFLGSSITAADAGSGVASITVAPSGIVVKEEGTSLTGGALFTSLNFIGSTITAADAGSGVASITVTSSAAPTLESVLITSNSANGLNITELNQLVFDSTIGGAHGIQIGMDLAHGATSSHYRGIAIGSLASATVASVGSIAIGSSATTIANYGIAIGGGSPSFFTSASASKSIAFGYNSSSTGASGIAIGTVAKATLEGVSIGHTAGSASLGTSNVAIGLNSLDAATGAATGNVAIGSSALHGVMTVAALNNVAVGSSAGTGVTTGASNTLIGKSAGDSITVASSSVCIGVDSDVTASGAANSNVAIGNTAVVSGTATTNSIALGSSASVSASTSVAIGSSATAAFENASCLGPNVASRLGGTTGSVTVWETVLPGMRFVRATVTTTAVTPVTMITFPILTSEVLGIDVTLTEFFGSTSTMRFFRDYHFRNKAGTVSVDAGSIIYSNPDTATESTASLAVSSTNIAFSITPANTTSRAWVAVMTVYGAALA
jgi:hypothetical protein